jgi:alkylation response protein AidB-like acyl-CoA dehydrogenase
VIFDLSDEQLLLEETVDRLLVTECPMARVHEIIDDDTSYDERLWGALGELGALSLHLPAEVGGAGGELLDLTVVAEVLGRRAAPGPYLEHVIASMAIQLAGDPGQQSHWLPKLATGAARATFAFTESGVDGAGWDPQAWTASDVGGLKGANYFVPHAVGADVVVVGVAGGGLVLVQLDDSVVIQPVEGIDRTRRLDGLTFHSTPYELLPHGVEHAGRLIDAALVLLAADAYGGAVACVEASVQHAKEREQFGVPIGTFQALQHQLADMALDVYPNRGVVWFAAHAWDHLDRDTSASAAANAKAHLCDRFVSVARRATEAHGGLGYTWESDVQVWLKRSLYDWAMLGDPGRHRRRLTDLLGW